MSLFNKTAGFMFNSGRIKQSYKLLFLLGFISMVSVSCGKKGPLYLSTKDTKVINKKPESTKKPDKQTIKDVENTPADSTQ